MELSLVWIIAERELREALRNRWLWFYTVGFAGLAFALPQAGLAVAGYAGLGGFGRTAASLINALLLFVPLIGLTTGASTLANERERGTLLYLLAQPISRAELFWGKALGGVLVVIASLGVGFGVAAVGLGSAGTTDLSIFLTLGGYTLLLALVTLGLGFVVSTLTRKASTASSIALFLWLGLVFFGDLGLIGATFTFRPTPAVLLGFLLINPLQIFKLAAIYNLNTDLELLGPVGQYATYHFADQLPFLLLGLLIGWAAVSFGVALWLFNQRGEG